MIVLQLRSIPILKDNQTFTLFIINVFYWDLGENETISELDEEDFLDENGGHEVHDDFKKDHSLSSNVNPFQSHFQRVCDQTNVIIPSHSNRLKQNPLSNKIPFENILKNWLPAAPFWTNLAMGNFSYVASLCAIKHNNAIQVEIYSVIYTGDLT